jgi:hypothetical protein
VPATLLMPGAGHLFLGYTKRAVVWFLAALLLLPAALLLTEASPSAFWVGLILAIALPMALVIAIASVVYWSWDSEQGRVRWSRLGRVVH